MKKAILGFADRLLSKEQMKKVRGGCGGGGITCYYTIGGYTYPPGPCGSNNISSCLSYASSSCGTYRSQGIDCTVHCS